jgi:mono/diheme cytochrome c family protein
MIKNPVALSHDPAGRIYVTETARRASVDIDVRRTKGLEPLPWSVLDWTLQSARDKRDLLPLLQDPQPRVRYHAAIALGKTGSMKSYEPLVALLAENNNEDTYLRHAGIMGLVGIGNVEALHALQTRTSVAVRLAAVVALRRLERPEIAAFLDDPNEQALRSLGILQSESAVALLKDWLNRLEHNDVPLPSQLDVFEAAWEPPNSEVQSIRSRLESSLQNGSTVEQYRYALEGGDAERGRQLFEEHPAAQCVLCHRVGGEGSTVGPDLAGVGSRKERRYLLESLVDPTAWLADGYTVASMPPMGTMLTSGQIRDLVAYLKSL